MAPGTPELLALAERLERFEKQSRRLKWAGVAVLLFVFAALLMGQAWPPSETIEARAFIVRDADGKVRVSLYALLVGGSVLWMWGKDSEVMQVSMGVEEGGYLDLYDANGRPLFSTP